MNFNPISHSQIMAHQNMQPALPESKIHLTIQELFASGYLNQNQGLCLLPLAVLDKIVSYLDEESIFILKITSIYLRAVVRGNLQFETKFTMRFFEFVSQKIVADVKTTWDQAKANQIIAKGLAKRGLFNRAEMFAARSKHLLADNISESFGLIAKQYALQGDHPGANRAIEQIKDSRIHIKACTAIARRLAQKGDYQHAVEYADRIGRLDAYKEISREQIKRRDDAIAFGNIRLLKNEPLRKELYETIALEQARRGDFAIASETAKLIPNEEKREQANQQIKQIQFGVSVPNSNKIDKGKDHANALEQLKKNDFSGCLAMIRRIPGQNNQIQAFQDLATVIYRAQSAPISL